MSAYIVKNECINRIVSYLYSNNKITEDQCKILGKQLLKMNIKAVCQRYGDKEINKLVKDYVYQYVDARDHYQVLKSLDCFLYQCLEGTVPKMKLYKKMTEYQYSLTYKLVSKLKQYDDAVWG